MSREKLDIGGTFAAELRQELNEIISLAVKADTRKQMLNHSGIARVEVTILKPGAGNGTRDMTMPNAAEAFEVLKPIIEAEIIKLDNRLVERKAKFYDKIDLL